MDNIWLGSPQADPPGVLRLDYPAQWQHTPWDHWVFQCKVFFFFLNQQLLVHLLPHFSVSPLAKPIQVTPLESVLFAIPNVLSTEMVSSCNSPMFSHLVMLKDSPTSQAFTKPSPLLQHLPAQPCQEGSIFPTFPLLRGRSSQVLAEAADTRTAAEKSCQELFFNERRETAVLK